MNVGTDPAPAKRSAAAWFRIIFIGVQIVFGFLMVTSFLVGLQQSCTTDELGIQSCSGGPGAAIFDLIFYLLGLAVIDVILFVIYYVLKGRPVGPPPIHTPASPEQGWYQNPMGTGLRWWDGRQWTEHIHQR